MSTDLPAQPSPSPEDMPSLAGHELPERRVSAYEDLGGGIGHAPDELADGVDRSRRAEEALLAGNLQRDPLPLRPDADEQATGLDAVRRAKARLSEPEKDLQRLREHEAGRDIEQFFRIWVDTQEPVTHSEEPETIYEEAHRKLDAVLYEDFNRLGALELKKAVARLASDRTTHLIDLLTLNDSHQSVRWINGQASTLSKRGIRKLAAAGVAFEAVAQVYGLPAAAEWMQNFEYDGHNTPVNIFRDMHATRQIENNTSRAIKAALLEGKFEPATPPGTQVAS